MITIKLARGGAERSGCSPFKAEREESSCLNVGLIGTITLDSCEICLD